MLQLPFSSDRRFNRLFILKQISASDLGIATNDYPCILAPLLPACLNVNRFVVSSHFFFGCYISFYRILYRVEGAEI